MEIGIKAEEARAGKKQIRSAEHEKQERRATVVAQSTVLEKEIKIFEWKQKKRTSKRPQNRKEKKIKGKGRKQQHEHEY